MTQQEIPADVIDPLPELPPPPAYWPSTVSSYTRVSVQRREHCDVCVKLAHGGADLHGPPRRAKWRRKGLPTATLAETVRLCDQHRRQYLNRDNEVRVKAHLAPLAGGG